MKKKNASRLKCALNLHPLGLTSSFQLLLNRFALTDDSSAECPERLWESLTRRHFQAFVLDRHNCCSIAGNEC